MAFIDPIKNAGRPAYWDKAVKHLCSVDPTLSTAIRKNLEPPLRPSGNPSKTIIKAIVGQQISVKAADAIWGRLEKRLGTIEPETVASADLTEMRGCGLSMRKAEYIKGIGQAWLDGLGETDWSSQPQDITRHVAHV